MFLVCKYSAMNCSNVILDDLSLIMVDFCHIRYNKKPLHTFDIQI